MATNSTLLTSGSHSQPLLVGGAPIKAKEVKKSRSLEGITKEIITVISLVINDKLDIISNGNCRLQYRKDTEHLLINVTD